MIRRDLFGLAIRNLLRRRARTFLAVIGVVVGICAIVVMLSIGFGLSVSFHQQVEDAGNLHLINVNAGGGGMTQDSNGKPIKQGILDEKAIYSFEKIPGVDAATPVVQEYVTFGIGKYVCNAQVIGIRPEVMEKFKYKVDKGRLLQPGDKYALVFGSQVPIKFYNPSKTMYSSYDGQPKVNVLSDKVVITEDHDYGQKRRHREPSDGQEKVVYKEYKAKGVGVLADSNDESSYSVYMNLDTLVGIRNDAQRARKDHAFSGNQRIYDQAMIYVDNIDDVEGITKQLRDMGFQPDSLDDWLKSMQNTSLMIQGILGGIGAISLFVAALGITNTMVMSIYERTKEIGVMKVLGANLKNIRSMFLLEAGLIGLFGGIVGLLLSFLISLLMNTVLAPLMGVFLNSVSSSVGSGSDITTVSVIPLWLIPASLAFSTGIGVLAGYYPARRAMRLSALESLKNE